MVTRIEAFQASDGTIFGHREVCEEYEFSLAWNKRIGEFIDSAFCEYKNSAQVSMVKKSIVSWERFKIFQKEQ